jgi:hypothetical protein
MPWLRSPLSVASACSAAAALARLMAGISAHARA